MKEITQADLANFSALVVEVWNDPKTAQAYQADPEGVLSSRGITLPAGVPIPVIPAKPKGDLGQEWQKAAFDNWDVTVSPLNPGTAGISISSLACAACPISSFSSLSN